MKIGILTYHCVPNFGAQMQAISTVGYLKRKGHEPKIIHWYPAELEKMYKKRVPSDQYKCHEDFTNNNMPLTQLCQTEEVLIQVIEDNNFDAIFLGSDALFKYLPQSCRKYFSKRKLRFIEKPVTVEGQIEGNPFWGSFIPKIKSHIPVAVFSVSSQNAQYNRVNKHEFDTLQQALKRFKYITVRDEWTKSMVEHFTNKSDLPITPDPVFSFNQNVYLRIPTKEEILNKYNIPENYVLLSFNHKRLSEDYILTVEAELKKAGLTAIAFPMPEGLTNYSLKYKIEIPLSPLDWYYLIKYSSGYIGERMHPIVVSVHNAIPFYCFDEYGVEETIIPFIWKKYNMESSKTFHILNKSGLLDNMTSYSKGYKNISPSKLVSKLLSFETSKADNFSTFYQNYYEKSMDILLSEITK